MGRIAALRRKSETELMELGDESALPVQGLARGLSVLRAFSPGEPPLSNAEIALRTRLPRPTVSRLTQTLTALGYLAYLPRQGRYALGAAVVALCHSLLAGMPHRLAARPILQELADRFRLPVSLGARDQFDIVNIETVRHAEARPARFDLGARLPLDVTAMGRAYLFALPEDERGRLLDRLRRRRNPAEWPAVRAGLERAFDSLAARGFCLSDREWRADVVGVGASVVTAEGLVLAVNCGGPPQEASADRLQAEVGPRLARAAKLIAAEPAANLTRKREAKA